MLNNNGLVTVLAAIYCPHRSASCLAGDPGTISMANILCVDDEPNVAELKCAILKAAGHQVTPATSAREAIEKLQHHSYDAIVTDWRLGDGDGRAVVQAAKAHSATPVVVVSGYVSEAFQAAEPLADLYLEKPVDPGELVTIVNELLKSGDSPSLEDDSARQVS